MDGKVKARGTTSVPSSVGRQIGVLPVGNPPVRPRKPKSSNSFTLPITDSGRTKISPPSPHSSRSQRLSYRGPITQDAAYSQGLQENDIKFVNVPNRKVSAQRLPPSSLVQKARRPPLNSIETDLDHVVDIPNRKLSGSKRPSSGSAKRCSRPSSGNRQTDAPKELDDDDEISHKFKTISEHEILEANHERDPEKIYEINLYASDLTKINNLQRFKKLRVLDLSCNYIDRIENLSENVDIRELKMYGNRIHQLENLYSLKELSNLQLQHNKIKTIGKSLSQCTKIRTLNLCSNHLMRIESPELSCCSHLTVLDLSSNMLDNFSFVNYLPNLEELNASNNRLRTVDFNRCKKLQDIDLSGNDLKDINGLKGMGNLQILNVSNNRITTIKPVGKLKLLTELYAADNHLSELSYIPTSFPVLEILNISRNNVASFEEVCSLNSLEELSELFISGNPFSNDDDGIHISYMSDIQAEFSNLDILDGAHLKRAAHRGAPLMRPMTASTIITVRQVETQMKQMDSDMKSIENDFMERMEQLKSTLDKLPSQPSDSSRSPKNNVSQSIHFTKTSSHSRIRDALKFAAEGLDSTEN
ncbi:uncharacterized protein LOC143044404 [Mytilus galloprovincialis]|uniref:uncharacterized protein LOC143044404 n=1 Tax=Mytilus galloprovincialis TaxID=29158 RepID=UPI003F7C156B